jgi:serine protease Do
MVKIMQRAAIRLGILGVVTATILATVAARKPATIMAAEPDVTLDTPPVSPINLRRTVTVQVVQQTKGAVVNISTTKLVNERVSPFGMSPFWQSDIGPVVRVPANSLGSGFIIHKDGYVVTNNHVVDRARQITVELADGRKLPAELLSTDPDADLAVLRVHSDAPLPTLELGESNDLMIGEPVIAVGNPLGFSHSVSTGIVSAIHRDIEPRRKDQGDNGMASQSDTKVHGEEAALRDLIQTDAAINPGNSGGPLLNAYGQVIGINTAIRGDAQNIGFAIPIDRLRDLIPELMNPAQVTKVDVPIKLAEKRTMVEPSTVDADVVDAASKSKVVESINGQHPANIIDAYAILLRLKANQPFDITYAGEKPQQFTPKTTPTPNAIVQAKDKLGLSIEQNTPMLAEKNHLSQEDGLFVDAVDPDSIAAKAGLKHGDIIFSLGQYPVRSLDDMARLLPYLPSRGRVRIGVVRANEAGFGMLVF